MMEKAVWDALFISFWTRGFDERFLRKRNYCLGYCEAAFQTGNVSVVQPVYTPPNNLRLQESVTL